MAGGENHGGALNGGISRARFLKLAGFGAGISLFPGSLVSPNAAAAQVAGGPDILNDGKYPIVAWWPPPPVPKDDPDPRGRTNELYAELAGAGFNVAIGGNGVSNVRANNLALNACRNYNENNGENDDLRFVISDEELRRAIDGTAPAGTARSEAQEEPQGVLQALAEEESSADFQAQAAGNREAVRQRIETLRAEFGDANEYPALAGISLYDEPGTSLFDILRYAKNEVAQQFGARELPYVNVWPSYASARFAYEAKDYPTYLARYLDEARYPSAVAPPVLSFDHYPLLADGRTTPDFFYNHAVIRKFSRRFGVPSWGYVQSVGFDGRNVGLGLRRRPDEAEIFWQINVALAYGVKGIQYFTYWTPEDNEVKFGDALITRDGTQTSLYDYATRANDSLRKVGGVLLPLTSASVTHFGENRPPRGAKPFRGDPYVKAASGDPAILGSFTDPKDPAARYVLVVNRSPNRASRTRLTVSGAVRSAERFDPSIGEAGEFVPVILGDDPPRFFSASPGAGRAVLYRLRTA